MDIQFEYPALSIRSIKSQLNYSYHVTANVNISMIQVAFFERTRKRPFVFPFHSQKLSPNKAENGYKAPTAPNPKSLVLATKTKTQIKRPKDLFPKGKDVEYSSKADLGSLRDGYGACRKIAFI